MYTLQESIKILYPFNQIKQISEKLNTSTYIIGKELKRLNLTRKICQLRLAEETLNEFWNEHNQNPYFIYFLGFLWADGHLYKRGRSSIIFCSEIDSNDIRNILLKIFKFSEYTRQAKNKDGSNFGKLGYRFNITDKILYSCLVKYGFLEKSFTSHKRVLDFIPENLHHYFWRGFFDGDGCLYTKHRRSLAFWSTIEQDWSALINIFQFLNIKDYSITKYSRKQGKHKSSTIELRKSNEIKIFLDYIYSDEIFGLTRKYNKYLEYINNIFPEIKQKSHIRKGICFCPSQRSKKWHVYYLNKTKNRKHIGWFLTSTEAENALDKYILENNLVEESPKPKTYYS